VYTFSKFFAKKYDISKISTSGRNIVGVGWATMRSGCLPITGCFRVYRRYQMPSSIFLHRYCLVFPGCLCESLLCSVLVVISLPLEILLRVSLLIRSTTVKWGNIVIGFYIVTSVENFLTSHNSRSNEFIRLV
jgi:hypothetical protein